MLIGILSDTHDRLPAMIAGMATLRGAGAEFFIHCGDVGGETILDQLAGVPSVFVWGNCDWDRAGLERYAADLKINCAGTFADLTLDGARIAVTHGDDPGEMQRAAEGDFGYLLHGHTHLLSDRKVNNLRIINPGALHRAARKTVAVLDTRRDVVRHLTVSI